MKLNRVGWKIHMWWSDHGISSTKFRGWISIKLGVNPDEQWGLNPAGRQDRSVGKIGIRGGREWG